MLKGKNIILRVIEKDDLTIINQWRNDLEIKNQALLHPFPVTKEMDEDWFHKTINNVHNNSVFFIIADKKNNVLGYTMLKSINWIHRNCYFGIIIGDKKNRGKGFGKETLKLITTYAFEILNLHKITLEVLSVNVGAIKLYEYFGFVKEGTLAKHVFINNTYEDVIIMSKFNKQINDK